MFIIDIDELGAGAADGGHAEAAIAQTSCLLTLRQDGTRGDGESAIPMPKTETCDLCLGLSSAGLDEIRWYLERHIQEPLETERAAKARDALYSHGRSLVSSLSSHLLSLSGLA